MAQYISKDALVTEIEGRKSQFMSQADNFHSLGMEEKRDHFAILASNMHSILSFIDTLEVKEVDLEKEIQEVQRDYKTIEEYEGYPCTMYAHGIEWIARHFFELGLKAQKAL